MKASLSQTDLREVLIVKNTIWQESMFKKINTNMASNRSQDYVSNHQEVLLETNTNNNSRCFKRKPKCTCPVCQDKEKAVPVAVIYKKQSDCQCDECQCPPPVCECEECCPNDEEEEEEICQCTTCKLDRRRSNKGGRKGRGWQFNLWPDIISLAKLF